MRADDKLALLIGGRVHDDWQAYEVESDLLTPADAWSVRLAIPQGQIPDIVAAGVKVEARVGGETVLTGRVDRVRHLVDKRNHSLVLTGRDAAAVLVDCSAPIFTARKVDLDEVIAKVVRPLGIGKIRISAAEEPEGCDKINVEPGEKAWDVLVNAAEARGLCPWFEPDGTLVVGGPDYSATPVAGLILRMDKADENNVLSLEVETSVSERYSEVTVLGQTPGDELEDGQNCLRATARDADMSGIWKRPMVTVDHGADGEAICRSRARKLLADSRLTGLTITARVHGHRIGDGGALWRPGQRVALVSEPHGLDGVFFLMARRFSLDRQEGTVTTLTLKEDKVWTLDAHPHKGRKRHELFEDGEEPETETTLGRERWVTWH